MRPNFPMDGTNKSHRTPKKGAKALKKRDKKGKVELWELRARIRTDYGVWGYGVRVRVNISISTGINISIWGGIRVKVRVTIRI